MDTEILYENEWVDLRVMREPESGVNGYVFSHERRCDGNIVAVLPFNPEEGTYWLREEVTPCWGMAPSLSALTGGVESGDTPETCAIEELREEAGILALPKHLISLGTCRGTKSTDTIYHLFAVDVTHATGRMAIMGDGSCLESLARMVVVHDIAGAVDPLAYVLHYRLNRTRRAIR